MVGGRGQPATRAKRRNGPLPLTESSTTTFSASTSSTSAEWTLSELRRYVNAYLSGRCSRFIVATQVEGVLCSKGGITQSGTVHLTAHHLILAYDEAGKEEMWVSVSSAIFRDVAEAGVQVPYPLISLVTRMPQTLQGRSPITFRTRTFETFTLTFKQDREALDVFDSVKDLTVASKSSKFCMRGRCNSGCRSFREPAVCVPLYPKSPLYRQRRMDIVQPNRRIQTHGSGIKDESVEVYRH